MCKKNVANLDLTVWIKKREVLATSGSKSIIKAGFWQHQVFGFVCIKKKKHKKFA